MRLSFPSLPSVNQSFSASGRNWKWSGTRWNIDSVLIKTPYQIAVEGGFQGTEQEYADSLNPTTVAQNAATQALSDLTGSAPELLNTIEELAAAINNDENFATTVSNQMTAMQSSIASMSNDIASMPNFTISSSEPTSQQGSDGDIWLVV